MAYDATAADLLSELNKMQLRALAAEEEVARLRQQVPTVLLDRDAVLEVLAQFGVGGWKYDNAQEFRDRVAAALLKLAQQVPSREEIAKAYWDFPQQIAKTREECDRFAGIMLALFSKPAAKPAPGRHCTCEIGMGTYPGDHHEEGCQLYTPRKPAEEGS